MPESIVEWKPRPRDRVYIRLSGGRFFTVPQSEARDIPSGTVLSEERIAQLSRVDQYFRGKDKASRLLAIRPRTRREIERALEGMGVEANIRGGIVAELVEAGLVDDRRFARDYVSEKVERKGLGPHRLRMEMQRLGLGSNTIDEALSQGAGADAQEASARRLVERKLGARVPDERDIRRIAGTLRRRGIDYEIINRVMYDLLERSRIDATFEEESE